MTLLDRLQPEPDRRQAEIVLAVERRAGDERRAEPRWRTWTRDNQTGKDLTGRAAA